MVCVPPDSHRWSSWWWPLVPESFCQGVDYLNTSGPLDLCQLACNGWLCIPVVGFNVLWMPDAFRLVDIMLQIQQLIAWEDKASMKAHFSLSDVLIGQSKVSFMGITCSGYAHHGDYLLRLCTSSLYQMLWGLKGIFCVAFPRFYMSNNASGFTDSAKHFKWMLIIFQKVSNRRGCELLLGKHAVAFLSHSPNSNGNREKKNLCKWTLKLCIFEWLWDAAPARFPVTVPSVGFKVTAAIGCVAMQAVLNNILKYVV